MAKNRKLIKKKYGLNVDCYKFDNNMKKIYNKYANSRGERIKKKIGVICILAIIVISLIITIMIINKRNTNQKDLETKKQITISVSNKENINIYQKNIETEKIYLIDVLKDIQELKVVTENSEYGEYIISIMEIEQGDNFYWTYYIDGEYATTGVSNCKIQTEKVYNFKIESINY